MSLGTGEIELLSLFCDLLAMNLGKSSGNQILLENRRLTYSQNFTNINTLKGESYLYNKESVRYHLNLMIKFNTASDSQTDTI